MPRDGSGVYSTPPGTHGTPNTTILSANYNSNVDDVAADLNTPRPIVAGGTGATTAADALTALGAASTSYVDTQDALKVAKAGDTMTGNLIITSATPGITLNKTAPGTTCSLVSKTGAIARWEVDLGNGTAESGGNVGSDLTISRCDDGGSVLSTPLAIARKDGVVYLGVGPFATSAMAVQVGFTAVGAGMGFRGVDNGYACQFQNAAGSIVGGITTSPTATFFVTSSDERLKEDLKSFDAGNIVDNTDVYDFAWKDTGERSYGVIAQQAIDVYPTAVTHKPAEDYWGLDYSKYVPVLLQELKALRARVAALEGGGLSGKPA